MTGKKENGATWHQATVALRSDIYRKASEQGIDIGDACNRALAILTGSEYRSQQPEEIIPPPPVIIAKDGASPDAHNRVPKIPPMKLHPVINADDPAAPATVVRAKGKPVKKAPAESRGSEITPVSAEPDETPVPSPAITPGKTKVPGRGGTAQKKRPKGDALRIFFSAKIARTDDTEAVVSKDEIYELFTRFCRDHRITPVPERKAITVALKNQFALSEKLVDGSACWTGIRLK